MDKKTAVPNSATADGLIESVGQELAPVEIQAQTTSPVKPKDGNWSFQFDHRHPLKLSMLVDVVFTSPFPFVAELRSHMNEAQVENLWDWLSHVLDVMNRRPVVEYFSPPFGKAGESVTITGKNFSEAITVHFGRDLMTANFKTISDNHIVATVPPKAQTGPISIRNPRGLGRSNEIFIVPGSRLDRE